MNPYIDSTADDITEFFVNASLSQLSDCAISDPNNEEILQYDSATSKWINKAFAVQDGYLENLKDCKIINPQEGMSLFYRKQYIGDLYVCTWNNEFITLTSHLSDVLISNAVNNQVLQYNSTLSKWTNSLLSHSSLLDIGSNTHSQIDSVIKNLPFITGAVKVNLNTTQNDIVQFSYEDGIDNHMVKTTDTFLVPIAVNGFCQFSGAVTATGYN